MSKSYRKERFTKTDRLSGRHYESSDRKRHSTQIKDDLVVSGGKRHRDHDRDHRENRNENRQFRSEKGDWKGYTRSNKRTKYSSNSKNDNDVNKQDKLYPDDPENDNYRNEPKSREQVLKEQKKDQKEFQKNRRMFGFVAGLLEKFEESNNNRQNFDMRQEIEAKIDQREEKERRAQIEQRAKKAEEKQMRQQLKRLQTEKNDKITQFETWEKSQKNFDNCILTRAKPPLYYTPREHNKRTKEKLEDTKSLNRLKIAEERVKHQKIIDNLESKINECRLACGSSINSDDDEASSSNNNTTKNNDNHKNENPPESQHRTRHDSRTEHQHDNEDIDSSTADNDNHNHSHHQQKHTNSHRRGDSKKDEHNTDKNVTLKRDISIISQSSKDDQNTRENVRKRDISFRKDSSSMIFKKIDIKEEPEEGEISERESDYSL